ncbi:MAG: hypothetical protein U0746_13815 [Gemmataceae bacterium]
MKGNFVAATMLAVCGFDDDDWRRVVEPEGLRRQARQFGRPQAGRRGRQVQPRPIRPVDSAERSADSGGGQQSRELVGVEGTADASHVGRTLQFLQPAERVLRQTLRREQPRTERLHRGDVGVERRDAEAGPTRVVPPIRQPASSVFVVQVGQPQPAGPVRDLLAPGQGLIGLLGGVPPVQVEAAVGVEVSGERTDAVRSVRIADAGPFHFRSAHQFAKHLLSGGSVAGQRNAAVAPVAVEVLSVPLRRRHPAAQAVGGQRRDDRPAFHDKPNRRLALVVRGCRVGRDWAGVPNSADG